MIKVRKLLWSFSEFQKKIKLTDCRVDCGQNAAQTGRVGDQRQRRGEIGELSG